MPIARSELMTLTQASELIRLKQISPVELVQECLSVIANMNQTLRAFITVLAEQALNDARKAESEIMSGGWKGQLHGIPIGIKDFYDTAGIPTTAGFIHFSNRIPDKDAVVVSLIRRAGGIIIGKTNMHELGMGTTSVASHVGSVRNPWNIDYAAGGSSGGSAAAVVTGMCYATVDTDAVGSCRIPAACCGVTGFKATYGLLSTVGILEGEPVDEFILHVAHGAVMCRSVEDTAVLLNALSEKNQSLEKEPAQQHIDKPYTIERRRARIGVVRNYRASNEVRDVFTKAADMLMSLDYDVKEVDAPIEPNVDLPQIHNIRAEVSRTLFRDVDVLLLPTTTDITPTIEQALSGGPTSISAENTFFANYYGLPAISIPCGFSGNGLPLGLQVVSQMHNENTVLAVANDFQQHTDWHRQFSNSRL
ncbi:amidase [Xylanibacillus composti]|uniref:Amidase domain-containing protein n=1 Tax=Xylanibacillus composti TaxID=1572762 RepID=A0A8J4M363_9BACL|nr:amidase [Xylanibacillus composti]MDT9725273.1 amidase [Xylanibacillus composti]GIQ70474.1 hypothetical protein XYCOK13_32980 [Xylanibacillus composti]